MGKIVKGVIKCTMDLINTRGVAWENFVRKMDFWSGGTRRNVPLLYDVIAITEVFASPFSSFGSKFCKIRQNMLKPVLHEGKPGQDLDQNNIPFPN
jgi:hypothetical protein